MARGFVSAVVLAMMLVSTMPLSVNAEDSGGVQASSSTVAITPSNPVEGGSVTIRLTLYNSNNFEANKKMGEKLMDELSAKIEELG